MLRIHKARNIWINFFHVPKTGGLAIRKVLDDNKVPYQQKGNQHDKCIQHTQYAMSTISVSIHRKPSDWLLSYWAWKIQYSTAYTEEEIWNPCEPHLPWHPTWHLDKYGSNDFAVFANNVTKSYPQIFKLISKWYDTDVKTRFEQLDKACEYITGYELPNQKVNRSNHRKTAFDYDLDQFTIDFLENEDTKYNDSPAFTVL